MIGIKEGHNNSNHSKRADLIKEWLAANQKTQ